RNMPTPDALIRNILSDMKVELTEMFDRNFERKGFFGSKWKPRKNKKAKGSLLHVTGKMRRSIRASVRGKGVHYSSPLPYTALHNEGGKFAQNVRTHTRTNRRTGKTYTVRSHTRQITMPKRQFIGDHKEVRQAIKQIVHENITEFFDNLAKELRK
ncbi:phage virion morphogenesis protein, partial [Alistipes putredinis]|uniref:phage virion morphogenesis protein n=1 Tax=Alistipes putredinis TaxID=28117 RepID=UPI003A87CD20